MTDKEKKSINQLKADTSFYDYELKNGNYIYELFKIEVYKKDVDVILNLIEKQSKEIEELKEKDDANLAYYDQIYQNGIYTGQKAVEDKIKAKIEEYDDKGLTVNLANRSAGKTFEQAVRYEVRKVLQLLLEEKE